MTMDRITASILEELSLSRKVRQAEGGIGVGVAVVVRE